MSNDEIQKFTKDIRSGANEVGQETTRDRREVQNETVYQRPEAPREIRSEVRENISSKEEKSFNWNLVTIPLSILFGYLLYLLIHHDDPKVVIEEHKTTILGWVQEMIESDLPPEVRQFYKADLKPGQTMIMYWQRNGDGPTREIIEFKPEHNKDIEKILQLRKK